MGGKKKPEKEAKEEIGVCLRVVPDRVQIIYDVDERGRRGK